MSPSALLAAARSITPTPPSARTFVSGGGRLIAVGLVVLLAACAPDDAGDGDADDADSTGEAASDTSSSDATTDGPAAQGAGGAGSDDIAVSATISIDPSDYVTIAARLSVDRDTDVRVDITATAGDHVVEIPRTAEAATAHSIPVVGMRAGRGHTIEVTLVNDADTVVGRETTAFTTGDLPDDCVDYTFSADPERPSPGYTLLEIGPDGTPYLLAIDVEGEVVWYYPNTGVIYGSSRPTAQRCSRTTGRWAFVRSIFSETSSATGSSSRRRTPTRRTRPK